MAYQSISEQVNPRHEALTINKNELNGLINSLNDIVFEFDERKVCHNIWFNKTRDWAIDLTVFYGKTPTEAIGGKDAGIYNDALDYVIANRKPITIEFTSFAGSGKWYRAKSSPIFDEYDNYTNRITTTVTDITQEKKLTQDAEENRALLVEAQSVAKIGDWWFDINTFESYWADNLYALLEVDKLPDDSRKFDYYMSQVHPDDRGEVARFFKKLASPGINTLEHRIYTAKGNLKYFKVIKGRTIKGQDGDLKKITGIIQDLTETRLADKLIKKSRAELLEAQTIAKIGNWNWSVAHKKLTCSPEILNIYEIDQQSADVFTSFNLLLSGVHADDLNGLKAFLRLNGGAGDNAFGYRIITPKGSMKFISLIIGKMIYSADGSLKNIIGTVQDVTGLKQAEIAHQSTEDKYTLVLETIKLAALTLNGFGQITFCNSYLANLLGYTQAEILGANWYERFVPAANRALFKRMYQDQKLDTHFINPIICRNGEERVISWQNTIIYYPDRRIKESTSIGEDITEQQKDREHLIYAKEAAERSSKFKSEFLSSMSHEIRTPMNAVIGITNLLLAEDHKPEQKAYLETLRFSGENLLGIINDILDYNRIEAGKLSLNLTPFSLHQLVANIRQSFIIKANEKSLEIRLEVDNNIPTALKGDTVRLSQILNNLVANALNFTSQGSVTIAIRQTARDAQKATIDFSVEDTGIGIAQDSLVKIFEPFTQEEQIANYGGSGLGLAITRKLIEMHNSDIKVTSELGKGTRFNFSIVFDVTENTASDLSKQQPTDRVQPAQPQAATVIPVPPPGQAEYKAPAPPVQITVIPPAPTPAASSAFSLPGMKVLVVDDNQMNVIIACKFLKRWQVETSEATNGLMALEAAKAHHFDLIIMDLQMPIMDGLEATRAIKLVKPDQPVIALTADAMPETYNSAIAAGMNDYLTKPFKQQVLFEKVKRFYKRL